MRGALASLLACALAAALAHAQSDPMPEPVRIGPCGPITRTWDQIELAGGSLRRLVGTPLARLGLVAYRGATATPIPFQVDERAGSRIAMPEGPEPTTDDAPGVLDADDHLVFMACDAGERAPSGVPPAATGREIRIDDPANGTTGWAYVVVADDPPHTDRRYVAYDAAHDLVRTARYRVGMVGALPEYFALALDGPLGPNLMDGLRLRAEATLNGGVGGWTLDERDGRHALIAWTSGPVRVVRRSRHDVDIGLGIHLSAGVAHTYFYAQHVFGPGAIKLPFSPSVFFRRIDAMGGVDMRALEGWHYLAPGVPAPGFAIDGKTSEPEHGFSDKGNWFALTRPGEAVLVVTTMSESLARQVPLELVYLDDATRAAPPEKERGSVPLVGLRGRGVERLKGGRYEFQLRIFGIPGWKPGDEQRILHGLDEPLTATVTRPAEFGTGRVPPP